MGLDMYLYKADRNMNQEEVDRFDIYSEQRYVMETLEKVIMNGDMHASFEDNALETFKYKLEDYDKWVRDGSKDDHFSNYVSNYITSKTLKFSDFESKDDLIDYYSKKLLKEYINAQKDLQAMRDDKNFRELHEKFKDVNAFEIHYWRKHADLHAFFEKIAYDRGMGEFNGQNLVIGKGVIDELYDMVSRELKGEEVFETGSGFFWGATFPEHWEDTMELLEDLVKNFDFDNNTLYYRCSW